MVTPTETHVYGYESHAVTHARLVGVISLLTALLRSPPPSPSGVGLYPSLRGRASLRAGLPEREGLICPLMWHHSVKSRSIDCHRRTLAWQTPFGRCSPSHVAASPSRRSANCTSHQLALGWWSRCRLTRLNLLTVPVVLSSSSCHL